MKKQNCKHEWKPVEANPYTNISTNDSFGYLCQFVCVCLKCNNYKTIVAKRIESQAKDLEYGNEGFERPTLPEGQKLGDEDLRLVGDDD